ncbi:MAG TPA: hypothetical protein VF334_08725 [Polyangia bacterium]
MRAVLLLFVAGLVALGAGGVPPDGTLAPLTSAVDDAQGHAAALAHTAATASPATLAMPTDDEEGAISAVVRADGALDQIMHGPAAVLPRETDIAVLTELGRAHDALGSYVQARLHANRKLMRASAADASAALSRADAILGADRSH